jgi:uncharacterized membrane protein YbhN (UPF0104 family)
VNRRTKQVVQATAGIGLATGLIVWGLPHFAKTTWSAVFHVVQGIPWWQAVGFQALMLLGLWCYTFTITASLPGLSHPRALIVNLCGSSVGNLLPGGGAAGLAATYAICRSWGFTRASVSTSALVTGVWNTLARLALPVLAIAILTAGSSGLPAALTDAAIGGTVSGVALIAVFAAVLASPRAAAAVGRFFDRLLRPLRRREGRRTAEEFFLDLREETTDVVRRRWLRLTLGMVGFFGIYFLLFVLITRATGIEMKLANLFAAYAIGRLLTAVGITPGGIGVTETATAAVLVGWGADPAGATATVVLFSIFTHLMEVPLGGLGWMLWSLSKKSPPPEEGHAHTPSPATG